SMNSSEAPRSFAEFFASAIRCLGVPCEPASPLEQMTKCTGRPSRTSLATIPPQANSMSSGCAPKASKGKKSAGDFCVCFIRTVNGLAVDIRNFRGFLPAQVVLFACAGNVMRAMDDRLHPTQPRIAGGADMFLGEIHRRQSIV